MNPSLKKRHYLDTKGGKSIYKWDYIKINGDPL